VKGAWAVGTVWPAEMRSVQARQGHKYSTLGYFGVQVHCGRWGDRLSREDREKGLLGEIGVQYTGGVKGTGTLGELRGQVHWGGQRTGTLGETGDRYTGEDSWTSR
jgi:hypothetical protein